jgi:hypothetical protein
VQEHYPPSIRFVFVDDRAFPLAEGVRSANPFFERIANHWHNELGNFDRRKQTNESP